jgi:uncharacterized protein
VSRTSSSTFDRATVAAVAGIGLRTPHVSLIRAERPPLGWLEVHSENYFSPGGVPAHILETVRCDYALSLHGVGLSLGSADAISTTHLQHLADCIRRFEPFLVSEHLCWGAIDGRFLNDLLPLPYTREALDHMVRQVQRAQEFLGRRMLIENISSYLEFESSDIPEWDFLRELSQRSGCGVLLDVNNIYVAACNHGFDPIAYIDAIPAGSVQEIHLAGHSRVSVDGTELLIDTHDHRVCPEVWTLYEYTVRRIGRRPTLIEWDSELPPLGVLLDEMHSADFIMEKCDV